MLRFCVLLELNPKQKCYFFFKCRNTIHLHRRLLRSDIKQSEAENRKKKSLYSSGFSVNWKNEFKLNRHLTNPLRPIATLKMSSVVVFSFPFLIVSGTISFLSDPQKRLWVTLTSSLSKGNLAQVRKYVKIAMKGHPTSSPMSHKLLGKTRNILVCSYSCWNQSITVEFCL